MAGTDGLTRHKMCYKAIKPNPCLSYQLVLGSVSCVQDSQVGCGPTPSPSAHHPITNPYKEGEFAQER